MGIFIFCHIGNVLLELEFRCQLFRMFHSKATRSRVVLLLFRPFKRRSDEVFESEKKKKFFVFERLSANLRTCLTQQMNKKRLWRKYQRYKSRAPYKTLFTIATRHVTIMGTHPTINATPTQRQLPGVTRCTSYCYNFSLWRLPYEWWAVFTGHETNRGK